MGFPTIPARVQTALRRAGAIAVFMVVGAAVWWWALPVWTMVKTHEYFRVSTLRMRGVGPLLSEDAIRTWLGIDDRTTIWELPPMAVRERLEAHPLIAQAAVRREFPNYFSISIRERRPEAIAVLDQCYYIDRHGHLLGALGPQHSRDYPIITGPTLDTPTGLRSWMYKRALRVVRICATGDCFGDVSEIRVDEGGNVVLHPMRLRASVLLGTGSWREKIARYGRVLRAQQGPTEDIRVVDLRYRNQVVVQREPSPAAQKPVVSARRGMRV